jgi:hypothetical protein
MTKTIGVPAYKSHQELQTLLPSTTDETGKKSKGELTQKGEDHGKDFKSGINAAEKPSR